MKWLIKLNDSSLDKGISNNHTNNNQTVYGKLIFLVKTYVTKLTSNNNKKDKLVDKKPSSIIIKLNYKIF